MTKQEIIEYLENELELYQHDSYILDSGFIAEAIYNGLYERGMRLLDEDQSLPECPVGTEDNLSPSLRELREHEIRQYRNTQEIMLSNNWRKVIPKE